MSVVLANLMETLTTSNDESFSITYKKFLWISMIGWMIVFKKILENDLFNRFERFMIQKSELQNHRSTFTLNIRFEIFAIF